MDPSVIGPATLSIGQAVSVFTTMLPHLSEIRKRTPGDDPAFAGDVRMGEIAASAITIGVGAIASSLTGSPVPAFVAVVMVLILVSIYEYTLRSDTPMSPVAPVVSLRREPADA